MIVQKNSAKLWKTCRKLIISKIQKIMSDLLACLCCCFKSETPPPPPQRPRGHKKKKKTVAAKVIRLRTKYKKEEILIVSEQDRHEKRIKAYCCPICTLYYTKILACSQCFNFICLNCFESYDRKTIETKEKLKCPFCSSQKSFFCDYELDPHSYFDATKNGFLSKEERVQMEEELHNKEGQLQPEEKIEEINEPSEEQRQ